MKSRHRRTMVASLPHCEFMTLMGFASLNPSYKSDWG
jgi:hypothetical protein